VRGYYNGGLFERFDIRYVATHRDGTAVQKAVAALRAYALLGWHLVTADAPLVHIHLSSRASFWRKAIVSAIVRARGRPYVLHVTARVQQVFTTRNVEHFQSGSWRRVLGGRHSCWPFPASGRMS